LRAALSTAARWPHGDPDRVAGEVLEQPAYRVPATADHPPQPTVLEQLETWLRHWLSTHLGFLHRLFTGVRGTGEVLELVVLIACGIALVVVGARALVMLARRATSANESPSAVTMLPELRTAAQWRDLATATAAEGRYEAAIAALFMAALRLLDEHGVVVFDAARTPGEYRRLVRRTLDRAAPAFDGLAARFVSVTYGAHEANHEDYHAVQRSYGAFAPLVRPG
jgi:hypothetical protein